MTKGYLPVPVTEIGRDVGTAFLLTDTQMQYMASEAARKIDHKNRIASKNSKYSQRIRRITHGLLLPDNTLNMNYKVYLADTVNAFAMADGTVRVYSGLMDMMNDDELRFVIGHEIGHVHHRHSRQQYQFALSASAARKGLVYSGGTLRKIASGQIGALAEKLVTAQFSQHEESEADAYGLRVLRYNHLNPWAAVSALQKLQTLGSSSNGFSFLSSHPNPAKRVRDIKYQISMNTQSN